MKKGSASSFLTYSLIVHLAVIVVIGWTSWQKNRNHERVLTARIIYETPVSAKKTSGPSRPSAKKPVLNKLTAPTVNPGKPVIKPSATGQKQLTQPAKRPETVSEKPQPKTADNLREPDPSEEKIKDLPGFLRKNDRTPTPTFAPKTLASEKAPEVPVDTAASETEETNVSPEQKTTEEKTGNTTASGVQNTAGTQNSTTGTGLLNNFWKKVQDKRSYRNTLAQLVRANWKLPAAMQTEFEIIVAALIDPEGNLIGLKIEKSSQISALDAAAERAVRVSQPFPQFPASFPENQNFEQKFRFSSGSVSFE